MSLSSVFVLSFSMCVYFLSNKLLQKNIYIYLYFHSFIFGKKYLHFFADFDFTQTKCFLYFLEITNICDVFYIYSYFVFVLIAD